MGMFDSIKIDIKCPFCNEKSEIECQTKELECTLDVLKQGDFIGTDKFNYLETIADCHSKECLKFEEKRVGYVSGFGRLFYVKVKLENGIVTGDYELIKK